MQFSFLFSVKLRCLDKELSMLKFLVRIEIFCAVS